MARSQMADDGTRLDKSHMSRGELVVHGSVPSSVLLIPVPLFGRARLRTLATLVRVNYAIGIKVEGIEPVKLAVMRCSV